MAPGLASSAGRIPESWLRWSIVAPASVGLGWVLDRAGVPAAWIIGAIAASAAMALITSQELTVNQHVYAISRGFIGVLAALPLTTMSLGVLAAYVPVGVIVALVTVGLGITGGLLIHRAQPRVVSRETGILSMLPGGASMMPVLADSLGANFRYVALTQYLRLLTVSISLPFIVGFFSTAGQASGQLDQPASQWWAIALIVAVAVVGEPLGKLVHLPVPSVMGPLVLTVIISAILGGDVSLQPPEPFRVLAFLTIGWVCGGGLSVPALRHFAVQLPATVTYIVAVIGLCALTAWPLTRLLGITYFEAYLATSPGALETVLALGADGGAGPAVVALQLVRLIVVLAIAGYLPQLIRLFTRRR